MLKSSNTFFFSCAEQERKEAFLFVRNYRVPKFLTSFYLFSKKRYITLNQRILSISYKARWNVTLNGK